ncbi:MAG: hypothetical protein ACI4RU_08585, partial [Acutalibacteraceae bacterium]
MKKITKRTLCLLLSAVMIFSTALSVFAVDYPSGVTKEMCEESSQRTDLLIKNAVSALSGDSLKNTFAKEIYKDETLSSLLTGIYSSLS